MPTKRQLTYHPLCRDLAELFLENEFIQNADERLEAIDDLAQDIQQAIEDWLSERHRSSLLVGQTGDTRRTKALRASLTMSDSDDVFSRRDRIMREQDCSFVEAREIVNERKARLVENLRSYPRDLLQLLSDAADEIERLHAEVERLRGNAALARAILKAS